VESACSRESWSGVGPAVIAVRNDSRVMKLEFHERAAAVEPAGLLILHHGRGADELDLLGLADALDPARRLHVAAPRGPLRLPGSPGYHWYRVPRVGYPDAASFAAAYDDLAAFHDSVWERTAIEPSRTVLGGFSMGSVMSYALALGPLRPAPAGILAFSGFIPVVEGWRPSLADRRGLRAFIAHGRRDPVIEVGFARRARDELQAACMDVSYHESDAAHHVDPEHVGLAREWLEVTLDLGGAPGAEGAQPL